jgi:hypothetical protein
MRRTFLLVPVLAAALAGCGSTVDASRDELVGNWVHESGGTKRTIALRANNSVVLVDATERNGRSCRDGTWAFSSDKLTFSILVPTSGGAPSFDNETWDVSLSKEGKMRVADAIESRDYARVDDVDTCGM